ncbi:Peptide methionine sulfoxide reductase MsrA domain [Dillenia turbinata]|uniref:peptide-methionine (S)-S-oxide reductase n=1 Tax=Dillenia turbinata TaxID=194707 RepID=A0AAN8VDC3_9MAGN
MYIRLPQYDSVDYDDTFASSNDSVPSEFLSEAVFAGDCFWGLEAALGLLDGVVKTVTGYFGGTFPKPNHKEVCEGTTCHTEAVKVYFDKRKVSYKSLCDTFWDTHDPTNKEYLNFGISTHYRSVIYYGSEEERKEAMESKIRRQMKLNKRIVTKIIRVDGDFYVAENCHQKYYLQKKWRICESLGLRSSEQLVESNISCKLNGILAMEGLELVHRLTKFVETQELPKQTKLACKEIIHSISKDQRESKESTFWEDHMLNGHPNGAGI